MGVLMAGHGRSPARIPIARLGGHALEVTFERDGVILAQEVVGAINEAEILARSDGPDAGQTVPRWEPLGG
jgi:hypothetical protein